MARELGDFTPVDSEPGKSRLVREDENDASDDEDDDEKRRIVFTVKEKSQRQKIAEEIGKPFFGRSADKYSHCFHCECSYSAFLNNMFFKQSGVAFHF